MTKQSKFDMNTVKGRLRAYLKHAGLTQAQFAARLGVSPAYIGAMRRGLSHDKVERLGEIFPDLNRDWLLYGDGEMLARGTAPAGSAQPASAESPAVTPADAGTAGAASGAKGETPILTPEDHRDTLHVGVRRGKPEERDVARHNGPLVPLLPVQAFAGNLQDWSDTVRLQDCDKIVSPVSPVDFAIHISGDSMEPEFADGTTLFIRRITDRNFMPWGHPVVIDSVNGVIFKLLYPPTEEDSDDPYVEARSLNPRYPPMHISCDTILGIYRVCAAIRIYNTI